MRALPTPFVFLVAVLVFLLPARRAVALPTFGQTCSGCHSATTGRLSVTSSVKTNLDKTRLDKQKAGALPTFTVQRGKKLTIPIVVLNGSSTYAVEVANFSGGGLTKKRGNVLAFTPGTGFTVLGKPAYYVSSTGGTSWGGHRTTYNFTITVKKNCPVDTYELYVRVAGTGAGKWSQTQRLYVQVR
jgi:hypothetical protein